MIEMLLFYKFSLGVAILSGGTLSLVGHHEILRGKASEVFALSQMALLGNLLFHNFGEWVGLLAAGIFYSVGKWFINLSKMDSTSFGNAMIGLYFLLVSIQYLLVGLFPQWDGAFRVGVFGNAVTAGTYDNILMTLTFLLFLGYYFYNASAIKRRSLDRCMFGMKERNLGDAILLFLPLIISLYGLGLLFTLGFFLLPGILLGSDFSKQSVGTKVTFALASIASFSGLVGSILFEKLGTTSLQVVLLFALCVLTKGVLRSRSPGFDRRDDAKEGAEEDEGGHHHQIP